MPILEAEQIEQTQRVTLPEYPRYFAPAPWYAVRNNTTGHYVVAIRYDAVDANARYYEGGAWSEPCDCGSCCIEYALDCVQRSVYIELTPAEALLRIGGAK